MDELISRKPHAIIHAYQFHIQRRELSVVPLVTKSNKYKIFVYLNVRLQRREMHFPTLAQGKHVMAKRVRQWYLAINWSMLHSRNVHGLTLRFVI